MLAGRIFAHILLTSLIALPLVGVKPSQTDLLIERILF